MSRSTLWDRLAGAASQLDSLPFSPSRLGERLFCSHLDRRERRAASDPVWAAIESKRDTGGPGQILLSDDLDLSDWTLQDEIADELTPEPVWVPWALRAKDLRLSAGVRAVQYALQRVQRGWDDSQVWSLSYHHERILGEQLLALAETAHGWPSSPEFPTFEDWQGALRHHGTVLSTHGWMEHTADASLDRWHDVATSATTSEEQKDAADALHREEEEAAASRVVESLHWVADHNQLLWD